MIVAIGISKSLYLRHKILDDIRSVYGCWYVVKWIKIFDTDRDIIKAKSFIVQSNVVKSHIKVKDLKNREPMNV
ncbi:hypothetical protein BCM20_001955 [Clostridium beijerinckii]|uniref:Uncharacterized protein n=1 Tax=Clostridium beijerinckii TaxID=1520 RepID=A0AAX0AVV1_CLOBE|nr:hypothetical protein [Clostridium beijerinckii]NOW04857.1 hypothetical protein [Clostridium beijerinckii]NRT72530.1 hypothetical protein [Clostridium beijerinckii]NRT86699.1 hypothetical protein [Clostridium beijerinckii]NYC02000.1 hypothetical protein [Clostridium beijerinckii]